MIKKESHFTILIGLQGVGKTTLGRNLATASRLPFFDTDHYLIKKWGQSEARDIRALFTSWGEARFRYEERIALEEIISLQVKKPSSNKFSIISTGGGAIQAIQWIYRVQKEYRIDYLYIYQPLEVFVETSLKKWKETQSTAPIWLQKRCELMFMHSKPQETDIITILEEIWAERHGFFQSVATFTYDTQHYSLQSILHQHSSIMHILSE